MHDQYVGKFPEGHEAIEAKRVADDSEALHRIINVIADLKDAQECTAVSKLEDKIHTIIRKEKSERADQLRNIVHESMLKATSGALFDEAFEEFKSYVKDHKLIKNDAFNFDLLKALYQFRNYLGPKGPQTTGKHFNHQLLAEVVQCYDDNYARFGNHWGSPKNIFFWQKVFGGVERHVPACDAQSIAQGLWYLLNEGEKSHRSLDFRYGGGKYILLGADTGYDVGHNSVRGWLGGVADGGWLLFKAYVEQKQQRRILSSRQSRKGWSSIK